MKRKILIGAAVTALIITLGFLTGCNKSASTSGSGKAVKITATYAHFGGLPSETTVGKAWEELMEKKIGVDLDITWNYIPQGEYGEKTNVILASNDLTDLTFIMGRNIAAPYEAQGIFEDISKHWDKLPLYQAFLKKVPYGIEKISNSDGSIYGFFGGEVPRLEKGLGIYVPTAIRYDTFQRLGIKSPETVNELLDAARKIKAAYPDKYPISYGHASWGGGLPLTYKTNHGIYWDGSKYLYGPITDNYRTMLSVLNRMYTEKLLDIESFNYNDDERARKALNDSNFIQLGLWFNHINDWNNNSESSAVWADILAVSDPAFGTPWQDVSNVNEQTISGNGEGTYIKAGAKNMDVLLKLCDLSYDPETIRLISWGIEGTTYTIKPDGKPTFVDKFHQSDNFWAVGDEYGIRASTKFRPGLQGPIETLAFIDCAPPENAIIDGKFVQVSWEVAFPNEPWPTSPWIPTNVFAPPISFTPDENAAIAAITTPITTYVDEQRMKFITGELNLNQWDAYVATIKGLNIQTVLDMQNKKAAAFK